MAFRTRLAGAVPPEAVARAVVRAIREGPPEIIVRSSPTRLLLAMADLFPRLIGPMAKGLGVVTSQRTLAERHHRSF